MALTVNFWNYSKKSNSTAIPSGTPRSFACELKSESGVTSPVLEIGLPMSENPAQYNYAEIPAYSRYYFVSDWQWSEGLWLCSLEVDPLASFRSAIGSAQKYVLRSAFTYDRNIADSLYPSKAWAGEERYYADFQWTPSLSAGYFVVGIINHSTHYGLPVSYYRMTSTAIRDLMRFILPEDVQGWSSLVNWGSETIIKALYDPMQYIVSCKWFPFQVYASATPEDISFGNYGTTIEGYPINDPSNWYEFQQYINLPTNWNTRPGRERVLPYCHIYLRLNPWGVIELDPADLTRADRLMLKISPDYITGDALLQIYAVEQSTQYLIYQSSAKASIDIQLSNTSTDVSGVLASLGTAVGVATKGASSVGAKIAATLATSGGVLDAAGQLSPSLSASGGLTGGIITLDGSAELRIRTAYFPNESVSELGRPLYDERILSSIPGYMKLADGDFQAAGAYKQELEAIGEFFTGGFYYE